MDMRRGAVAITLLIVAWSGSLLLEFFGITVDSLRAAGGVIVFLIGLQMLSNKSEHQHSPAELEDAKPRESIAVVPLAIPIVAGPGTMAVVIVAAQQHPSVLSKVEISIVILALSAFCGLLYSLCRAYLQTAGQVGNGRFHARDGLDPSCNRHGHVDRWIKGNVAWTGRLTRIIHSAP